MLDALTAFRPVVDAVAALHAKNIVHRDIKPDNIFVASDGRLVLADCGLAFRIQNQDRLTRMLENVGTRDLQPCWSQGMRLADVQPNFDLFSLGKALWAMVSGTPKFLFWCFDRPPNDPRRMFPDEPAVLFVHDVLRKCIVEFENETGCATRANSLRRWTLRLQRCRTGARCPGATRRCGAGSAESGPTQGQIASRLWGTSERTTSGTTSPVATAGTWSHSFGHAESGHPHGLRAASRLGMLMLPLGPGP